MSLYSNQLFFSFPTSKAQLRKMKFEIKYGLINFPFLIRHSSHFRLLMCKKNVDSPFLIPVTSGLRL